RHRSPPGEHHSLAHPRHVDHDSLPGPRVVEPGVVGPGGAGPGFVGPGGAQPGVAHDLVTLGEVLLRLAVPSPARFETARTLDVQIGRPEGNVAAARAPPGMRVAGVPALPANPW